MQERWESREKKLRRFYPFYVGSMLIILVFALCCQFDLFNISPVIPWCILFYVFMIGGFIATFISVGANEPEDLKHAGSDEEIAIYVLAGFVIVGFIVFAIGVYSGLW